MKTNTATLFLSNLTCIDHAYCNPGETIQGGSFMASFVVTGNIEPVEQVVVDFSTLKKDIKNIIDDMTFGLDHKLWVFKSAWDEVSYEEFSVLNSVDIPEEERLRLVNKAAILSVPRSAVYIVQQPELRTYSIRSATTIVQSLVETELSKKYPGIKVECILSERAENIYADHLFARMFRYTHGLKNSTSLACQNIVHGHLSTVVFYYTKDVDVDSRNQIRDELEKFVRLIENAVYVLTDNVASSTPTSLVVKYETEARGKFCATYNLERTKAIVLDEETTIENLTNQLTGRFLDLELLKKLGVTQIHMSEGLQKGSILTLNEI